MTNPADTAQQAVAVVQTLLPLLAKLLRIAARAKRLLSGATVSYENTLLDFTLDLNDPAGHQARLRRRQVVLFRTREAGVIRCAMWGDGDQLQRLLASGADRLLVQSEGSRKVLLLGLTRPASRGARREIRTQESLRDAFLSDSEYFEASVERLTHRMRVRVIFPRRRPPTDAYLQAGSQRSPIPLPLRVGKDGRVSLSWSLEKPAVDAVYSFRWSW